MGDRSRGHVKSQEEEKVTVETDASPRIHWGDHPLIGVSESEGKTAVPGRGRLLTKVSRLRGFLELPVLCPREKRVTKIERKGVTREKNDCPETAGSERKLSIRRKFDPLIKKGCVDEGPRA